MRRQPARDALQRVTRGHLRLPPLVDVPADSYASLPTYAHAFGLQALEARAIDRFERQTVLEPSLADRFEGTGGLERLVPFPVGTEALEADGARGRFSGSPHATRPAQRFRASAFKLAAGQRNPLVINGFVQCNRHVSPSFINSLRMAVTGEVTTNQGFQ